MYSFSDELPAKHIEGNIENDTIKHIKNAIIFFTVVHLTVWGCRTVDLINCTTAPYYLSNLTYCTTNFSNAIVVSTFHSVPSTNL